VIVLDAEVSLSSSVLAALTDITDTVQITQIDKIKASNFLIFAIDFPPFVILCTT
jgi:hypothetical protein